MSEQRPPVLAIRDLTVAYRSRGAWLQAVRDVSLQIMAGERVGLVGESGSGKSTIALAVMGYLREAARVLAGEIILNGRDLLSLDRSQMRALWGAEMALVPQDPLSALNPSLRIGEQLAEALRLHLGMDRARALERAAELLEMVRIPDPERVVRAYPHQISGGMQQRVMIALALSTEPALLVLDEPTTALDVTTQAAILDLFRDLTEARETAALYVTHNLGVVAEICDRVAVLYAGDLVEEGPVGELFRQPLHPYTHGLLASVPRLEAGRRGVALQSIPGQIPPLGERPPACVYADRCPLAIEICHEVRPPRETPLPGRAVRCHRWEEVLAGALSAPATPPAADGAHVGDADGEGDGAPVLDLDDVEVHFEAPHTIREILARRERPPVRAVDGVSLEIAPGRTLGLVGESGSGKTTLARAVVGLEETTGGEMALFNLPLPSGLSERSEELLSRLQIVFQNPEEALNPYRTVGATLRRPLMRLQGLSREEADAAVARLLEAVRLPASYAYRLPRQLSGGEKQRAAIARAFAADPELLVADEPVSSLDVSVQASILNLLNELQRERDSSTLFISHDLAVVGYLADEIAVMYGGHLMELMPAEGLLTPPHHPYTEVLLAAIPRLDPDAPPRPLPALRASEPGQNVGRTGCPFHPRCPRFLGDICVEQTPPWRAAENGGRIFCHIPLEDLQAAQVEDA
ncbi:MAG: dipeptide ABC transporter ATP-binding protein [Candidatus Promineifilaceae bacterium]|nr:dipeptide ABC transporter ATP-binding protein [Candidatus Promineifilaceae bacterium]